MPALVAGIHVFLRQIQDVDGRDKPGHDGEAVPAETRRVLKALMAKCNPHPGEILLEEFLRPMGLSQNGLARAVHVAPRRINEIVLGKRDITADTDLRLARYFGMSEGFFLGLQMDYDLMQRRREIDRDLKAIRPRAA
jgi:antitoxin HigA-1